MIQRRNYTTEFKQGAVRLVTDQGRTISDAAASLGIPARNLDLLSAPDRANVEYQKWH